MNILQFTAKKMQKGVLGTSRKAVRNRLIATPSGWTPHVMLLRFESSSHLCCDTVDLWRLNRLQIYSFMVNSRTCPQLAAAAAAEFLNKPFNWHVKNDQLSVFCKRSFIQSTIASSVFLFYEGDAHD